MSHPRGTGDTLADRAGSPRSHPVLSRMLRGRHRLRQLDSRRPWLLDTGVVLLVAAFGLPGLIFGDGRVPFGTSGLHDPLPSDVLLVLSVVQILPLWWRRRAPVTVFLVVASALLMQGFAGTLLPSSVSGLVALFNLARHGPLRLLGWAVAASVAGLALLVFVLLEPKLLALFFLTGTVIAATASGLTLRISRMYLTALEDRTQRLETERTQRERLTAAAERARIAREMHDIVGHNLSVMVTLADGAERLAANNGEQSAGALRLLGDTGRQAMGELRRVLGVLREETGDGTESLSPQPGTADLDALIARVRAAGLTLACRTSGDLGSLGEGVQLAVYRIVQEALTNTLKHAGPGSTAEVSVTAAAAEVHVRVADTGPPPALSGPAASLPQDPQDPQDGDIGHGLVGIRQRTALYGGTATLGPRRDRPGWLVDVLLDAAAPPPPRQTLEEPLS
ncbi:sensor histidine kinase [Acrocarpospora pleiomorpha]|nr:histidine kinase [Acrocarpospora pleiomorpha]